MHFDDDGRLLTFTAERYGEFDGKQQIKTWTTPVTEYSLMAGLNLPVSGLGVWRLPSQDFCYIDVRLTAVQYNQPGESF